MSEPLRFVPPRQPLVDKNGTITRQWYLFLQGVFDRIGGATGQGSHEIVQGLPDDAGTEETKAMLFSAVDSLNQTPAVQVQMIEQLQAELASQRDQLAELSKAVQGLQQNYYL